MDTISCFSKFLSKKDFTLRNHFESFLPSSLLSAAYFELVETMGFKTSIHLINPNSFIQYQNTFAFDAVKKDTNLPQLYSVCQNTKSGLWQCAPPGEKIYKPLFIQPLPPESRELYFPDGFSLRIRIRTSGFGSNSFFVEPKWLKVLSSGELINGYCQNSSGMNRKIFTLVRSHIRRDWRVRVD